jgi:hypothetical protein
LMPSAMAGKWSSCGYPAHIDGATAKAIIDPLLGGRPSGN